MFGRNVKFFTSQNLPSCPTIMKAFILYSYTVDLKENAISSGTVIETNTINAGGEDVIWERVSCLPTMPKDEGMF